MNSTVTEVSLQAWMEIGPFVAYKAGVVVSHWGSAAYCRILWVQLRTPDTWSMHLDSFVSTD